ncbi:MAG TPA: sigma-70 family RNA polymerase sigma factor [Caulobacteraceae bacterium]|nr:sigma-70 family RNA polymerase sigma factor [Caulobacteraceae bacterium]
MRLGVELDAQANADPGALIVAVARERSRASFAALFSRFAPKVKSYLIKQGCRPEQAEELAQETLLTVWRKAEYFDPSKAGASTWIFTIARNLRIDALRRERRPDDLLDDPALRPVEAASADSVVVAAEREGQLRIALRSLPEEQAEVIRLSFFSDKPHSEISLQLGLPLGTVKSRLRLAMARLRAALEDRA